MQEILLNTPTLIEQHVFNESGAYVAVTSPSVSVDNVSLIVTQATNGLLSAVIPSSSAQQEKTITVIWSYTLGGVQTVTNYYKVVTPYAQWSKFKATFEALSKTYADFLDAESCSRYIINWYCGQNFGKRTATYLIDGQGLAQLTLPEPLIDFTSITYEDNDSVIRQIEQNFEIGFSGFYLRPKSIQPFLDTIYMNNFNFHRNTQYIVTGTWGWNSVPPNIYKAASLLINDYICDDSNYRNKYLDNIKSSDWRIQFNAAAFDGTGNVLVDELLEGYRLEFQMEVI